MNTTIMGIGNAGCNIAESIRKYADSESIKSAKLVLIDTKERDLNQHAANDSQTILLKTESEYMATPIFDDVKNLIIISGLGGRTGTKFTELAAKAAKYAGIENITAIVTIPFGFEGEQRTKRALEAARRLTEISGVKTIIFKNEDVLNRYSDLNFFNAFEVADNEIANLIEIP